MNPQEKMIETFTQFMNAFDVKKNSDELVKAFETMVQLAIDIKQSNVKERQAIHDEMRQTLSSLSDTIRIRLAQIRDGKDGKDGIGKDGKDGVNPDPAEIVRDVLAQLPEPTTETPEQIRAKIEQVKLPIGAIEDLSAILEELRKLRTTHTTVMGGPGAAGGKYTKYYDLSSSLDGVTKTFALPAFWRVLNVQCSSSPTPMRENVDYTIDGSLMKITFASNIDATTTLAAGQTLIILYAEA